MITVERAALSAALNRLAPLVPPAPFTDEGKRSVGILQCVHGLAVNGWLCLTVTNGSQWLSLNVACKGEGEFATPAVPFRDVAEKLFDGMVGIACGDNLTITAGRGTRKLMRLAARTFPFAAGLVSEVAFIPASVLRENLSRVEIAIDRRGLVAALTGARLRLGGGRLGFTGLHKGFAVMAEAEAEAEAESDIIIPRPAVSALLNAAPEAGDVEFLADDKRASFAWDTGRLTTTLIQGRQPDVEMDGFTRTLSGWADEIAQAIDGVAAAVASIPDRPVTLILGGQLLARAEQPKATGEWEIAASYEGAPLTVSFAAKLPLDALAQFKGRRVDWHLAGPFDASLITSPDLPGVRTVVFPRLPERMEHAA